MKGIVFIAGSSHAELAGLVAQRLCLSPAQVIIQQFANKEICVDIQQSVRDMDVYIIQTACGRLNDHLMELLILIHACKIASAARGNNTGMIGNLIHDLIVTAILPCFPYSRHITWPAGRPISGALSMRQKEMLQLFQSHSNSGINGYRPWAARAGHLIASIIEAAGADHVFAMDLHNPQLQGFFHLPLDNLPVDPLLVRYIQEHVPQYREAVVVSPDTGGAKRAAEVANLLTCEFALIHQPRVLGNDNNQENIITPVLVGSVEDRVVILVDDMVDTSATLLEAARLLRKEGAAKIYAMISHGIFSTEGSMKSLEASEVDEVIVTNTIPQAQRAKMSSKLRIVDISLILSEAIRRAHNGESISYLFSPQAFT